MWKYVLDTYWILENFQVKNFGSKIFVLRFIRFRQKQDKNTSGLSNSARMRRRNRNLVTTKFHLFNWILETLSTFIVIILNLNRFSTLIYIFTISYGTPLVYFMGIEENRKMTQEHFRAKMRVFSKKKQSHK